MKKLILIFTMVLFLLPKMNCLAQNIKIGKTTYRDMAMSEAMLKLQPEAIMIRRISVQDLIDYQKECHDDSVLVSFETISNWKPDSLRTLKLGFPCYVAIDSLNSIKGIYVHPHHPTLEGFIEFMKNKIDENNSR